MRCGALVTPAANKNNNRSTNRYCGYLLSIFPFLYDDTNGNVEQVDHAPDRPSVVIVSNFSTLGVWPENHTRRNAHNKTNCGGRNVNHSRS